MDAIQRVKASFALQPVDRLPTSLHNFQVCAQNSGLDFDTYFHSAEAMAQAQYAEWQKYGHDILMVENGTTALAEALGCKAEYHRNAAPAVVSHPLADIAQPIALPHSVWNCPTLAVNLRTTQLLCQKLAGRAAVMGRGDQGPLSLLSLLTGIDTLMVELIDGEEEIVHARLEECTQFIISYCLEQLRQGALITSIGDSTSGPDLISPAMYRTFALPYHKKIAAAVHAAGGLLSLHICGNATAILPDMIESGADVLEIDQKTDLPAAMLLAKGKTALWGRVSPMVMRTASPQEMRQEVAYILEQVPEKTGFVVSSGCALSPDTPEENMRIVAQLQSR